MSDASKFEADRCTPARSEPVRPEADRRRERLAAALRENLRRRKAQAREAKAREAAAGEGADAATGGPGSRDG